MTRASEKKRLKELKGHIRSKHYHATFEPLFEDVGDRQDERNKDYRKG